MGVEIWLMYLGGGNDVRVGVGKGEKKESEKKVARLSVRSLSGRR